MLLYTGGYCTGTLTTICGICSELFITDTLRDLLDRLTSGPMSDSNFGVDGWASITSTSVVVFANLVVFCAKLG